MTYPTPYIYRWRVRTRLAHRFGQLCRVIIRAGEMNSCLVEFQDGQRHVTSRNFLRKDNPPVPGGPQAPPIGAACC